MHTSRRFLPPVFLGLSLVLSGCGGSPEKNRTIAATDVAGGAGFAPTTLTVNKDDNVILSVGNTTSRVHGFTVEGYGIREEVQPGPAMEVKFKSRKPGTFRIYCQLHETHQIATLIVQ